MAEIVPYRRAKQWTRPADYGATRRAARSDGGWFNAVRESGPILWAVPLAGFVAAWFATAPRAPAAPDRESASFAVCGSGQRITCVIDGDTFWYRGEKIRVADINTPETSEPKCTAEAELGARATARFTQLLNAGPFTLEPIDRARDKYDRALFVVTRSGQSLGDTLVREGLAEEWRGWRREWC